MSRIPPVTILVPRNNVTYCCALLAVLCTIVALDSLYVAASALAPWTTDGMVAALDLDAEGSIAAWVSIVLLFLCGLGSLVVRTVRQTMADCRAWEGVCWLAVSLLWFTMSLDEGASLHEGFKELMVLATGTRVAGDGSIYWVVPYFLVLSTAGCFLLWAIRHCRSAVVSLVLAGGCYGLAAAVQLELLFEGRWPTQIWVEESAEMLADLLLLMTLALYARSLVEQIERAGGQPTESRSLHRLVPPPPSASLRNSSATVTQA